MQFGALSCLHNALTTSGFCPFWIGKLPLGLRTNGPLQSLSPGDHILPLSAHSGSDSPEIDGELIG